MGENLFDNVVYNLYDIFFNLLEEETLHVLTISSNELKNIVYSSGGFMKTIRFDWKTPLVSFTQKCTLNTRLNKLIFNGGGTQFCVFDFPIPNNITTMVLKDHNDNNLTKSTIPVTSKSLKLPSRKRRHFDSSSMNQSIAKSETTSPVKKCNVWDNIKYLFIIDNNAREFEISMKNFPNLIFIGLYKTTISIKDIGKYEPFAMDFRDNHSIELMVNKPHGSLTTICNQLQKIYA